MRIASISKSFTAVIAGQFVEKGKLTWDDTIDKHHSDLPKFLYENIPVSITLRQLASHTRYVILLEFHSYDIKNLMYHIPMFHR